MGSMGICFKYAYLQNEFQPQYAYWPYAYKKERIHKMTENELDEMPQLVNEQAKCGIKTMIEIAEGF